MEAIAFDTHQFVKRLTTAGMPEAQAEILADEQARLITERLASKRDVKESENSLHRDMKELEAKLQADMKELETNLQRDIANIKFDLLKWLVPMMFAQVGIVAALVKLL